MSNDALALTVIGGIVSGLIPRAFRQGDMNTVIGFGIISAVAFILAVAKQCKEKKA